MKQTSTKKIRPANIRKHLAILVAGTVGLTASIALMIEKIHLIENPDAIPACNLNPILSCTSAISSFQSELFGVPLPLIGVGAYSILLSVGALLLLGTKFSRIVWRLMFAAVGMAVILVHYLIFESLFVLHVICPWCASIWITTMPLFIAVANLYAQHESSGVFERLRMLAEKITARPYLFLACWYGAVAAMILFQFRDFWLTLLS